RPGGCEGFLPMERGKNRLAGIFLGPHAREIARAEAHSLELGAVDRLAREGFLQILRRRQIRLWINAVGRTSVGLLRGRAQAIMKIRGAHKPKLVRIHASTGTYLQAFTQRLARVAAVYLAVHATNQQPVKDLEAGELIDGREQWMR